MKELSIHIKVFPIAKMKQTVYKFEADQFDYDPTPEDSDAGRCYICDKDIYITTPTTDILNEFSSPQYAIVEIKTTRGHIYKIGNNQIPALISLIPHINCTTLQIKCKMLHSPLI